MPTIIMDSCSYTRLGLTDYLTSNGVKKRQINAATDIDNLHEKCTRLKPSLVFINEDCFIHESNATERIKRVISLHPDTLFFIFMAITNVHFDDYLYVRKNVIISSKSIKPETMNQLLSHYLERKPATRSEKTALDQTPVTLSQTESNMLRMWMSGQGTIQISDQMQIKAKTVSSHKGNIKRKIKTHNKQIIYHVVRLTDTLTSGIFVNSR
ncbi:transcriptional regulator RcsA [Serratia rhizosphaerae]|uniref:transcriptional regulator RcsA n=1 Tax=unclassified Serratia (in: enterobacteria) TaxID=2647522 RepID=UPI000CF67595|nr:MULTISPECIES: transcriptional regulator RcsA [unclassified Serratia (in: enterobacteria)]MBU3895111.1 transcriptional regulator RcsA [Serratia rubidaea]AVJ18289.1 transcriptional regulator RcsA [Serratia sp. MYb239]MCA4824181.1 transcriptional regulator RcsA [Serratia rubidaea]QNK34174.1 transcriptional regulator RcsA [Serratia sp. JUb9]QPT11923.1 transcriptional regulator RcsA [Serratia rubidaea]